MQLRFLIAFDAQRRMTTLSSLVRSYQALESTEVAQSELPAQIALGLTEKSWRLIDVVKELGAVLISENDAARSQGVALLAAVVGAADRATLDRQSTKTLTTFFVDKLVDSHSMISCVLALTALTESPAFGVGEGVEVTRGIFAAIKLPSHPQSTRFLVYSLLDALMSRSRSALKRLGKEFTKGYCEMAEGEKDPRNLMMSFGIIRVILVEFDLDDCVDDLFDVTFCYFPITFTPPPDDPYGITSDDLVVSLRNCLSATPRFGKLALPLFLDKMQAASEKAKRQTLQALIACFPIYGAAACGEWAGRFSEAMSIEVFHATDDSTLALALTAFQALFATLYPDYSPVAAPVEVSSEDVAPMSIDSPRLTGIEGVGIKVIANSLDELREPEKSNAVPAMRILAALVLCSHRLAEYIITKALDQLLRIHKDPDEVSLRAPVLTSIGYLLAALATPVSISADSSAPSFQLDPLDHSNGQSPLEPYRDDLLSIYTSGSRVVFSRPPAMDGLVDLIKIEGFLSSEERNFCVSALNDILSGEGGDEEYEKALDGLVSVSKLYPAVIEQTTLPLLFAQLPSTLSADSMDSSTAYKRALESLASLCPQANLFELLALRLLARLEGICSTEFSQSSDDLKLNSLYAHHLLLTLQAVLRVKIKNGDEDVAKYIDKFLPRLFGLFVLPTLTKGSLLEVAMDRRVIADAGKVIGSILQKVDTVRQSIFASALNEAFFAGNLTPLLDEQAQGISTESLSSFHPLDPNSPIAQQNLLVLFSSALVAMRPSPMISVAPSELDQLLKTLLSRTLSATNEVQRKAALEALASTINKRSEDLTEFLSTDLAAFWETIVDSSVAELTRRHALETWAWIAKALIHRSDQRGYAAVSKLLELFQSDLGSHAAIALGIIVEAGDRVLIKENGAVIRLLYKQRFFTFLLPKIVEGHKSSVGADQAVYLIALSSLLQHIPKQMSLVELPKLLPLLITALELPDPALRANVIDTLGVLAREVPAEMSGSVSSIVLKVLKGIVGGTQAGSGAIKLRLASLAYLAVLPEFIEYSILHPQKVLVLKELGKAVDDPRREVRRAAVDCRSKWFLYSG